MGNFQGCGILWGVTDSMIGSITGFGAFTLLQSNEVSEDGDEDELKNSAGVTKVYSFTDRKVNQTLEFIPTAGTNTGTLTVTAWPSIGTTLTVTDALLTEAQGTFLVVKPGCVLTRSNTKAMMARISLRKYVDGSIP